MLREELGEYPALCSVLQALRERHEEQKARIRVILNEIEDMRQRLVRELGKTYRLSRRLTSLQRKQLGFLYGNGVNSFWNKGKIVFQSWPPLKIQPEPVVVPELNNSYTNLRELRSAEIRILSIINAVKKEILYLELLELRFRELLISIAKSLEAYNHEWLKIRRMIYPFGIISICCKRIRELWGYSHFSRKDLEQVAVLKNLAGNILTMALSPVLQGF